MKLLEIQNAIHPESKNRFTQKYSCKLESPQVETPRSCKEKQLEDLLHFGPDNCYQFRGYPMYLAPRTFRGNSECRESPDKGTCSSNAANSKGNFSDANKAESVKPGTSFGDLSGPETSPESDGGHSKKGSKKDSKKGGKKGDKSKKGGKDKKSGKKDDKKKRKEKKSISRKKTSNKTLCNKIYVH